MKKLTLTLDDLEVTSFAAQDAQEQAGTVDGMQMSPYYNCNTDYYECRPSAYETQCLDCTEAAGCYPSLYCTGPHGCAITYQEGCMTDGNAYC